MSAGDALPSYWLMKTEPDVFSYDDLELRPGQTEHWDGVRNYQARNFMRDQFRIGDQVLFYHSRTNSPGIVGIAEVVKEAYPDPSALDPNSSYFDPKSATLGQSRWVMVDVRAKKRFARAVTLEDMRREPRLAQMLVLQKGQRLSIQPVSEAEWDVISRLSCQ